ncbi:MAG: hypothetical protein HOQ34_06720 [Gemmatimonadaceae bacterium]|nr:hypothetical protein [Gemmatimonadaceae bacterium]
MEARWTRAVTLGGLVLFAMSGELRAQTVVTQRVNFRVLPARRAVVAMSPQPGMRSTSAVMRLGILTLWTNEPSQKLVLSLDRPASDRILSVAVVAPRDASSEGRLTSGTEATDVMTRIPMTGSWLPITVSMSEGAQITAREARLVTYTLIAAP